MLLLTARVGNHWLTWQLYQLPHLRQEDEQLNHHSCQQLHPMLLHLDSRSCHYQTMTAVIIRQCHEHHHQCQYHQGQYCCGCLIGSSTAAPAVAAHSGPSASE